MSFFSKILIFLLGLSVLAVVSAWIMGGESKKYSTRISIEASPVDVFQYLVDGEKMKQWANGIVSAGPYEADDDDAGAEEVAKLEFKSLERVVSKDGKESVWEDSILRFEEGETLSIKSRKGGLARTIVFQLEENEIGGTTIDYRLSRSASGWEQLLFAFQKEESRTHMGTEMTRLKNLVESEVEFVAGRRSDSGQEVEAPVVAGEGNGNNTGAIAAGTGSSVVDQVLGPIDAAPEKPKDGTRNFESLFGTGRR